MTCLKKVVCAETMAMAFHRHYVFASIAFLCHFNFNSLARTYLTVQAVHKTPLAALRVSDVILTFFTA